MIPIHPDDVLDFNEVCAAMRRVAANYELPLKTITGLPMPKTGMANRLGDCSHDGHIRIVMRCTENGEWCPEPCNPKQIWETAAHELAHLRHFNHGSEFLDFCEELQTAMENQRTDHKQKVLDKLIKLQASRNSEAELGNADKFNRKRPPVPHPDSSSFQYNRLRRDQIACNSGRICLWNNGSGSGKNV